LNKALFGRYGKGPVVEPKRLLSICAWCEYATTATIKTKEESKMKFRPLHDRVLLRRLDSEEKTSGGIIIPETAKEKPMQGEVVAVGSGSRDESGKLVPLDVKAGDAVLFSKWSGTEVTIDGVEYLVVKESDIMGIVEGQKKAKKAA
jgi:chaperonin GroES